jgi:hypothetical protein
MKAYRWIRSIAPLISTSVIDGRSVVTFGPLSLYPRARTALPFVMGVLGGNDLFISVYKIPRKPFQCEIRWLSETRRQTIRRQNPLVAPKN